MRSDNTGGMLSPYRVLDLSDEKGFLCGKLLSDLGADVIKIEKPGGDLARRIGPFYHDIPDPEKSLYWFAYNTNKRSITLNIETADGRELFKRLVKTADFVVESFMPGYMDKLGLGYQTLSEINPGIIMVSITPFGQTGPYKDYKASDIVCWALSGALYVSGEPDRPPVRTSHVPQSSLHGSVEGAAGAMMALYYREITGEGQHVDISIQECMERLITSAYMAWSVNKRVVHRVGGFRSLPPLHAKLRTYWPCKDGIVQLFLFGGEWGGRTNRALVEWMESEGKANDFLKGIDWDGLELGEMTQDEVDEIEAGIADFFMTHTKAELYQGGLKRRLIIAPVATAKGMLEDIQLKARDYWIELEHYELGTSITYPGVFFRGSGPSHRIQHRAPLIGEHNSEIYAEELGLSKERLVALVQGGVI